MSVTVGFDSMGSTGDLGRAYLTVNNGIVRTVLGTGRFYSVIGSVRLGMTGSLQSGGDARDLVITYSAVGYGIYGAVRGTGRCNSVSFLGRNGVTLRNDNGGTSNLVATYGTVYYTVVRTVGVASSGSAVFNNGRLGSMSKCGSRLGYASSLESANGTVGYVVVIAKSIAGSVNLVLDYGLAGYVALSKNGYGLARGLFSTNGTVGNVIVRTVGGTSNSNLVLNYNASGSMTHRNGLGLARKLDATLGAVDHVVVRTVFGTGCVDLVLNYNASRSMMKCGNGYGLAGSLSSTNGTVGYLIVGAVIGKGRINVILNNNASCNVSACRNGNSLTAEFLTAKLAVGYYVVSTVNGTVGCNAVLDNCGTCLVSAHRNGDSLAAELSITYGTVGYVVIGAVGDAVGCDFILNDYVACSMILSRYGFLSIKDLAASSTSGACGKSGSGTGRSNCLKLILSVTGSGNYFLLSDHNATGCTVGSVSGAFLGTGRSLICIRSYLVSERSNHIANVTILTYGAGVYGVAVLLTRRSVNGCNVSVLGSGNYGNLGKECAAISTVAVGVSCLGAGCEHKLGYGIVTVCNVYIFNTTVTAVTGSSDVSVINASRNSYFILELVIIYEEPVLNFSNVTILSCNEVGAGTLGNVVCRVPILEITAINDDRAAGSIVTVQSPDGAVVIEGTAINCNSSAILSVDQVVLVSLVFRVNVSANVINTVVEDYVTAVSPNSTPRAITGSTCNNEAAFQIKFAALFNDECVACRGNDKMSQVIVHIGSIYNYGSKKNDSIADFCILISLIEAIVVLVTDLRCRSYGGGSARKLASTSGTVGNGIVRTVLAVGYGNYVLSNSLACNMLSCYGYFVTNVTITTASTGVGSIAVSGTGRCGYYNIIEVVVEHEIPSTISHNVTEFSINEIGACALGYVIRRVPVVELTAVYEDLAAGLVILVQYPNVFIVATKSTAPNSNGSAVLGVDNVVLVSYVGRLNVAANSINTVEDDYVAAVSPNSTPGALLEGTCDNSTTCKDKLTALYNDECIACGGNDNRSQVIVLILVYDYGSKELDGIANNSSLKSLIEAIVVLITDLRCRSYGSSSARKLASTSGTISNGIVRTVLAVGYGNYVLGNSLTCSMLSCCGYFVINEDITTVNTGIGSVAVSGTGRLSYNNVVVVSINLIPVAIFLNVAEYRINETGSNAFGNVICRVPVIEPTAMHDNISTGNIVLVKDPDGTVVVEHTVENNNFSTVLGVDQVILVGSVSRVNITANGECSVVDNRTSTVSPYITPRANTGGACLDSTANKLKNSAVANDERIAFGDNVKRNQIIVSILNYYYGSKKDDGIADLCIQVSLIEGCVIGIADLRCRSYGGGSARKLASASGTVGNGIVRTVLAVGYGNYVLGNSLACSVSGCGYFVSNVTVTTVAGVGGVTVSSTSRSSHNYIIVVIYCNVPVVIDINVTDLIVYVICSNTLRNVVCRVPVVELTAIYLDLAAGSIVTVQGPSGSVVHEDTVPNSNGTAVLGVDQVILVGKIGRVSIAANGIDSVEDGYVTAVSPYSAP